MSLLHAVLILAAGLAAGTVNTIVGSGTLITFPTLLALGYSPVVANVTNTVGLVPGSVSGAYGYRRELRGQQRRILYLSAPSIAGGITGAVLLLVLPGTVFDDIVPVLIVAAVVLILFQPKLARGLAKRREAAAASLDTASPDGAAVSGPDHGGPGLWVLIYLTGVYGGYFGAAQGVIFIALLAIFIQDHLQRLNAAKNVVAALVNGVAAIIFMVFSHVVWEAAGVLAVGSVVGGQLGATIGRRLSPTVLRAMIAVVGTAVAIKLIV
ncbi:MAG: sulfite exporter TauE/SafE family protein [Acidimicrobiales bacterium]